MVRMMANCRMATTFWLAIVSWVVMIISPAFIFAQSTTYNATDVPSLLAAAASVNRNPGQSAVIQIAPGTYLLTESLLLIARSVSLQGQPSLSNVSLVCSTETSTAVLFQPPSESTNTSLSITRMAFSGCSNTSVRAVFPSKGLASMRLTGVTFSNNTGSEAGGLLVNGGGNFTAELSSCTFSSNTASTPPDFHFPAFAANAALITLGGGAASRVSVMGCSFVGNLHGDLLEDVFSPHSTVVSALSKSLVSSALGVVCEGNLTGRQSNISSYIVNVSDSHFEENTGLSSALLLASAEDLYTAWPLAMSSFEVSLNALTFTKNMGIMGGGAVGMFNVTSCSIDGSQFHDNHAGILTTVSLPYHLLRLYS